MLPRRPHRRFRLGEREVKCALTFNKKKIISYYFYGNTLCFRLNNAFIFTIQLSVKSWPIRVREHNTIVDD